MGGKGKLADKIISQFPGHTCYVEPFCGGAAIFFKKTRAKVSVINDVNGDLINFYRCLQQHPEELLKQSTMMLHSRFLFDQAVKRESTYYTDIQRAALFYAVNRMAFGGRMVKPTFGYARTTRSGLSAKRFYKDVTTLSELLDGVFIEHLDWADVISRYDSDKTLFYCDPPYFETAGYGMTFDLEQYKKMATIAGAIKGRIIISLNDHPVIREIFAGFTIEQLAINYSLGNHAKSGKEQNKKPSYEVVIKNF